MAFKLLPPSDGSPSVTVAKVDVSLPRKGSHKMTSFRSMIDKLAVCSLLALAVSNSSCAERHPLAPRVPEHKMSEAKAWVAPFGDARTAGPEVIAEGKKLYEGKGACVLCHGLTGRGDGPAAHMHRPHAPRNFTDCGFQMERTDGELFWVIKHGSAGTGMVPLVPGILTEEEAWKLVAYLRTFCRA